MIYIPGVDDLEHDLSQACNRTTTTQYLPLKTQTNLLLQHGSLNEAVVRQSPLVTALSREKPPYA